jgi:hypothetical protein
MALGNLAVSMPDEFPTLEAALALGVLVALARTSALWSGFRATPELMRALEETLRAGQIGRARSLCDRSRATTAARFGRALVQSLAGREAELGAEPLVERALARASAGVRRGHARDLVALAVLVGAGAYAERAALGVGRVFYGLLFVALALTVLGALVRQRTLQSLLDSAAPLTAAARHAARGAEEPS